MVMEESSHSETLTATNCVSEDGPRFTVLSDRQVQPGCCITKRGPENLGAVLLESW